MRWWHYGLMGGGVLSLATLIKLIHALIRGRLEGARWSEATGFGVSIFVMGFLCGLVVWAGKGLYQRFGMFGDAIVGLMVMIIFFICCMLLFDPEMLGAKFTSGGIFMLGVAIVSGFIGGAWIGRDIRSGN